MYTRCVFGKNSWLTYLLLKAIFVYNKILSLGVGFYFAMTNF